MKKIGRYVVISELGRGAMGIVYKASDPTIGREVALKVLSLSASSGEGTSGPQEMFMREVRAAGRLAHPSIVTIHDAFEDQESRTSCIVMELVPGMTLEKILDSGHPLTIEQSLYLLRQVAEGLDYAHRNQVIHRDLKPANILVTQNGRAKITDFGIAKVLAREGMARTVGMMGTPSYMSPEQVRGSELDGRTDIFSLGIIIFTMLSGQKPFAGNAAAVMFKIVYEEPAVPSSLNPQLTPAHDYVVRKCMAKDRNLRYSTARDLLGDLDDLQHGRPPRSQAVAPTPAPPAPPSSAVAPPLDRTLPMPIPSLMKAASQHPSPHSAPPQRVAAQPPKPPARPPVTPGVAGRPVAPPAPLDSPLMERTLPMPKPNLSALSSRPPSSPRAAPAPPAPLDSPLMERTLPMPRPDLAAVSPAVPPRPKAAPLPLTFEEPTLMEPTFPLPGPDLSAAFQPAGAGPATPMPPPRSAARAVAPTATPGALLPAPKSKLLPLMLGGLAVVLLAAAMWGFWKFHQTRTAPSPLPQVAAQTPPGTPPPVPTPGEFPTPSPAAAGAQPGSVAPEVAKKIAGHRPKQATTPPPPAAAPAPPPAQPEPVIATPPSKVAPPTPSPEAIAKAEAAKFANVPRIVKVLCNFGFKEATFTFSTGGQILVEETLKGEKKKGGFLGIKGSYQRTFERTITVPAGASEVSIRVVAREGTTDVGKTIKMPPPGGFIPTLAVEVDSDHLSLNWKSSAAAN